MKLASKFSFQILFKYTQIGIVLKPFSLGIQIFKWCFNWTSSLKDIEPLNFRASSNKADTFYTKVEERECGVRTGPLVHATIAALEQWLLTFHLSMF
jgi:hypothetical protein